MTVLVEYVEAVEHRSRGIHEFGGTAQSGELCGLVVGVDEAAPALDGDALTDRADDGRQLVA